MPDVRKACLGGGSTGLADYCEEEEETALRRMQLETLLRVVDALKDDSVCEKGGRSFAEACGAEYEKTVRERLENWK